MALTRPFAAYNGPGMHVFVCYAHADASLVYPEITLLHERGVNIWYDEGIEIGQEWRAEIAAALENASTVLFYQSKSSIQSKHCVREIGYALDRDIPVVRRFRPSATRLQLVVLSLEAFNARLTNWL